MIRRFRFYCICFSCCRMIFASVVMSHVVAFPPGADLLPKYRKGQNIPWRVQHQSIARILRSDLMWFGFVCPLLSCFDRRFVVVETGCHLVPFGTGDSYAISLEGPHGAAQLWFGELFSFSILDLHMKSSLAEYGIYILIFYC